MNSKWRLTLCLALATTYFAAGCASDVGDIDRTQPNKLEKALFQNDDEWYFRQTIVDTDIQGSAYFEAWEGSLSRIRWTITEDRLLAYSTTEPAENVLEGQTADETIRVGLVAAFSISKHFDVQRGYNASTGEQGNVISENSSDRNWYEREFMRVDWSRNLAITPIDGFLGQLSSSSRTIPQEDGVIDPDRVRISDEYIDAVTEYEFKPDNYACYATFGADAYWRCQAGAMRVRNSFLKLNKTKTYAPMDYLDSEYVRDENGKKVRSLLIQKDGVLFETECVEEAQNFDRDTWGAAREQDECAYSTFDFFQRFGYFRTERVFWDNSYGSNKEESRLYYANRWNIWKTMFDEAGELLPMADRVPKPIVYYTNVGYPKDMWRAAEAVAADWDDVFTGAAALAKGVSAAQIAEEVKAEYNTETGAMYEIRWNACSAPMVQKWNDEHGSAKDSDINNVSDIVAAFEAAHDGETLEDSFWAAPTDARRNFCAAIEFATEAREEGRFDWQRVGDLRYSFFNWVEEANNYWSGYGPSAPDPVTGEIISGNANYAGFTMRETAAYYADLIQYLNGDLEEDRYALGEHRNEYLADIKKGVLSQRQALTKEGKREMAIRAGAKMPEFEEGEEAPLPDYLLRKGAKAMQAEAGRMAKADWLHKESDTRMADFYNKPEVKNLVLADPNFRLMVESKATAQFGPDFSDDQFHQAYLTIKSPNLEFDRYQRLNAFATQNNILLPNVLEDEMMTIATYSGVSDHFKGKPRDEIVTYILEKVFYGTQLHEVGHTVGLRHNFAASYDAMNYFDEFWNIQKAAVDGELSMDERNSITAEKAQELGLTNKENIDYVSQSEFRSASVMDYGAGAAFRFQGLGKYDRAAIYFAYARQLEQFEDTVKLPNFVQNDFFVDDYTELPFTLSGNRSIPAAADRDAAYAEGVDAIINGRRWISIDDAMTQQREGIKKNTDDFKADTIAVADVWQDRTVPYNFCSDERRGYQLGCEAGDWGSNQREVVNHKFDRYRSFQGISRYSGGTINKWYENINRWANFVYGTLRAVERPFRYYSIYRFNNLQDFLDDLRDASIDAINFYAEVIATPEPGRFCKFDSANTRTDPFWYFDNALDNTYVPAAYARRYGECGDSIDIDKGVAQYYNYDFTDEYYYRATRVGTYVDKSMATSALFQISANTVDSAFFTDQRATAISYWTLFGDELYTWMRGIIVGDYTGFAGVYNKVSGKYEAPLLIDQKKFGTGLPNSQKNMERVLTNMSFNHEFNALVGAMLQFTSWQDRAVDFSQYLKVSVTNGEAQPFPAGTVVHEFVHPVTNQIYTAAEAEDGKSITAELVDFAVILGDRYDAQKAILDATPDGDDRATQREIVQNVSDQLQEVTGKLDTIRFIFEAIGQDSNR